MDPRHGELSRALRNRGIEICMLGEVNIEICFWNMELILHCELLCFHYSVVNDITNQCCLIHCPEKTDILCKLQLQ